MSGPIFANHAPAMRRAGFAVLPAAGKRPIRSGFSTWRYMPSISAVEKWAEREPGADIVYIPGLCQTARGARGIVVVDGDDEEACGRVVELFGDTPGKVRTRRGQHFLYRGPDFDLGKVSSLKAYGLNADLKHGQAGSGIVVAPPSRHEKDRTFAYAWDGCDETVIRDLPPFDVKSLRRLIGDQQSKPKPRLKMRDGSRGLWLNDNLIRHVCHCDTFDDLLEVARGVNASLADSAVQPLDDGEVVERAKAVWADCRAGKIEKWAGGPGVQRVHLVEMEALERIDPRRAPDALFLLLKLRAEHAARCARGETFAISPTAMAQHQVLSGWTRDRYAAARDLLLQAERIVEISAAKSVGGKFLSAQFVLRQWRGWNVSNADVLHGREKKRGRPVQFHCDENPVTVLRARRDIIVPPTPDSPVILPAVTFQGATPLDHNGQASLFEAAFGTPGRAYPYRDAPSPLPPPDDPGQMDLIDMIGSVAKGKTGGAESKTYTIM